MNLVLLVFFGGLIGTVEVEIVSKVSMEKCMETKSMLEDYSIHFSNNGTYLSYDKIEFKCVVNDHG